MPARWHDAVPKATEHPETGFRTWRIGDVWLREEAWFAQAGWKSYPPDYPKHLDDDGRGPGGVAGGAARGTDGRVRDLRAGALPERHRLLRAAVHAHGTGDRAGVRPGLQRLPHRVRELRLRPAHPDHDGSVLGRRRRDRRDGALLRARPSRHPLRQQVREDRVAAVLGRALGSGLRGRTGDGAPRQLPRRRRRERRRRHCGKQGAGRSTPPTAPR